MKFINTASIVLLFGFAAGATTESVSDVSDRSSSAVAAPAEHRRSKVAAANQARKERVAARRKLWAEQAPHYDFGNNYGYDDGKNYDYDGGKDYEKESSNIPKLPITKETADGDDSFCFDDPRFREGYTELHATIDTDKLKKGYFNLKWQLEMMQDPNYPWTPEERQALTWNGVQLEPGYVAQMVLPIMEGALVGPDEMCAPLEPELLGQGRKLMFFRDFFRGFFAGIGCVGGVIGAGAACAASLGAACVGAGAGAAAACGDAVDTIASA